MTMSEATTKSRDPVLRDPATAEPGVSTGTRARPRERSAWSPTRLIGGLADDVATLFRKELALARVELASKVDQVRAGTIELGAGALVLYAGALFLLLGATAGVATVMPFWGAALIVGGLVTLVGAGLVASAQSNLKARNLKPDRSLQSLREDARLAERETERIR